MSFSTIFGLLAAIGLFGSAIYMNTDNYIMFLSVTAAMMVFGGTIAGTLIAYEPQLVWLSLKLITRIVFSPAVGRNVLKGEVGRIIRWAYAVQKGGIRALEKDAESAIQGDVFLKFGVQIVTSGYQGQEVREIMNNVIESTYGRNMVQVDILKSMGAAAPSFGMIGTLVGLIIMLDNLGGDPSELGKGLAVALMTTLYGVLAARIIFIPAATKMNQRERLVRFRNYLIVEGLVLLTEKKSPRQIQDRMNSYLDPSIHFDIDQMRQ